MAAVSAAVLVVVKPAAAEIAPANIKLARAPRNAFFTVLISFSKPELNYTRTPAATFVQKSAILPKAREAK
jgi:hypothetical protein